jgi:hypothetical protein
MSRHTPTGYWYSPQGRKTRYRASYGLWGASYGRGTPKYGIGVGVFPKSGRGVAQENWKSREGLARMDEDTARPSRSNSVSWRKGRGGRLLGTLLGMSRGWRISLAAL